MLHRVAHETVKLGSDNPDNYYQTAAIHGDFDYRISGRRNSVKYLGFGTQAGHYGQGGGMPPTGYVEAEQIEVGEDGYFELTVSSRPHDGNWLPMTSESRTLIVRQTFLDRATEESADLRIERINCAEDERRPAPLTPEQIDEGLKSASTPVAGASMLFANWARGFKKHTNTLPMFDPEVSLAAGGDPNIVYYHTIVVQTHRDPKKAVASFCSMVAHGRGILSDHVDPGEIAGHWVRKMQRMLERSLDVRNSGNAHGFVDVSYHDLMATPIDEVRKIYRRTGIEFTEQAENAATAVSKGNVRDRHGKHVYSLNSFGLDADKLDEHFGFYRRAFRIPDEGAGIPGIR